ncbi:hypothetical protein Tco_0822311 [Tanacetum coccineum]|uniref:No apical meristem-associated C-terminal domain-containing protein n=1 Tax=Tanacetum coccineum TaxID=301880 RepID=A0ABQ5AHC7_9ASTR
MEDFNTATKSAPCTKNMLTGKWSRINSDCQKFNAIYKHLTRKSSKNEAEHIENAKDTYMERSGNKKFQYLHAWNVLKSYPKWGAMEPIDEDNLAELFGPDPRARPTGKPRPGKKAKSMDTSSVRGSQSESLTRVISQDYRRKCEAAEAAYEVKRKKELGFVEYRELVFLMIDPSSLQPEKAAYIRRKQDEIMKKYSNA